MVGIVILNYNDALTTIACVDSVVKYNSYPAMIVVVDNASTDDSVRILRKYEAETCNIKLLESGKNGGYACGNNVGIRYFAEDSDVDRIMVLNSDVLFTEDIIPRLSEVLESSDDIGIVCPLLHGKDNISIDYNCARLCPSNGTIILTYLLQYRDIKGFITKSRNQNKILLNNPEKLSLPTVEIELPSGSCMLIKKDVFSEIGWFDENTFLYYEENILFRKLQRIGKRNLICPSISCIHLGAHSTSKTTVPFLKTKEAESARYYLENYADMNPLESIVAKFAFEMFSFRRNVMVWIRNAR